MDVSHAQVSNLGDEVILDDPGWPWTIRVRMSVAGGRLAITGLTIDAREGFPVTSATLAALPMRQLSQVVASVVAGEGEAQYRMLALPRPAGKRSWPRDHFFRVARVAAWADATGRPGGGSAAVAEFWGVHRRTACRWISQVPA